MGNKDFLRKIAFNASEYSKEKEYWMNILSGRLVRSSFPYDFNRVADEQSDENNRPMEHMDRVEFKISGGVFEKLMWTVNDSDLRLFMILVSGLMILLGKHTGQEDILIGAPIERQEVEGNFLNTILALRAQLDEGMTFKELLLQVRQVVVESSEHQNFPIDRIVYDLNMDIGKNDAFALFDTVILLENLHDRNYIAHISLNMVFSFLRTTENLEGVVQYNSTLYKKETVRGITDRFVQLFQEAITNLDIPIVKLNIMPESEKELLLVKMNDTRAEYPNTTIHELFEVQVEKTPGCIAVEEADTGRTMTYKELNRRANQLANLLSEKGVIPGAAVAVMGERTNDIVTSILAILKAGGVFLPLDAQNPDQRLHFILEDSGVHIFISQERIIREREPLFNAFSPGRIIAMDDKGVYNKGEDNLRIAIPPTYPAYIIYTSGTTGKPKGVIVEHRSLVNYIWFANKSYVREEAVNFPLYTSIAFDLTITAIFTPLVTGNTVIVYSGWNKGNLIERIVDDNKVGVVKLTPSHLYLIGEKKLTDSPGKIRRFIVGGEVLNYQIVRDINDNFNGKVEIYNEYGPTEATVGCMLYKFDPVKDRGKGSSISIGVPAANAQIYLLDKNQEFVPMGAVGEIYIGGDGLARGYLNLPELTNQKFLEVQKPFFKKVSGPRRVYRTGDLARFLNDGNIEFLGRVDHQVKIRGFRIELGEIESQLLRYKAVKEVVVIIREAAGGNAYGYKTGDSHICAYIVAGEEFSLSELREYLAGKLPDYMIPSYYVRLDAIPLTPNGKVDMRALPEPGIESEVEYVTPRNETEKRLAGIWSEILGVDAGIIGVNANFFELGGHSLSGTVLTAKIHKAFDVKLVLADLFRLPTLRELAQLLEESKKIKFTPIELLEEKEYYPLSSAQERLFVLQQFDPGSVGYNVPLVFNIEGEVSLEKIHNAFQGLIRRHENFRTSFIIIDDRPVQKIHKNVEFEIEYYDLSSGYTGYTDYTDDNKKQKCEPGVIINSFFRPFDLSNAPLMRLGLLKTREGGHLLLVDLHHIITDGTSQEILRQDFMRLYKGEELPSLRIQYKDFSGWQNSNKEKDILKQQEAYWLSEFEGEIPVLDIPTDYPRPIFQSFEGSTFEFLIGGEKSGALKQMALEEGATSFMVILSIFTILLAKLSGQEDIVVGTDIEGRRHADIQHIIGMFVNTLALRNFPAAEKKFKEFLGQIKDRTLKAFDNQDYQLEELVEKVAAVRDTSRNPIFDVMLSFMDLKSLKTRPDEMTVMEDSESKLKPHSFKWGISKFDLTLTVRETAGGFGFFFEYCTKLFREETIRRFAGYFKQIVSVVLDNRNRGISEIHIISLEEKKQILFEFNNTRVPLGREKNYSQLFEEEILKNPGKIAAVYDDRQIAYYELNEEANRIAAILSRYGVTANRLVSLVLKRSIAMLAGIIGVFKAGGAYVPIEVDYPPARIEYILEDSEAQVVITENDYLEMIEKIQNSASSAKLKETGILCLNQGRRLDSSSGSDLLNGSVNPGGPDDLAYIIYTSGTTGKPKGVMIHQLGMINHLYAKITDLGIMNRDIIAQTASACFDISVWQFLAGLLKGGVTCIIDKEIVLEGRKFLQVLRQKQVTILETVPSLMKAFLEVTANETNKGYESLRWMIPTGEALAISLARDWFRHYPGTKLVNAYGPTEVSDDITHYRLDETPAETQTSIPVGKPLQNLHIYILDKNLSLCPVGVRGEICVSGIGVGKGYWKDPEKTGKAFIANPYFEEIKDTDYARIYKTGDTGYFRSDGNIEFLGRIDYQVKIRGFRVELGEIENRLTSHNEIEEAVVDAKTNEMGDTYLCAYIVSNGRGRISRFALKEYLSAYLPDYMIPSYFVNLEKIPLTANGKVDRKGLPDPVGTGLEDSIECIRPQNALEKILVEIWQKVLGREKVGINQNFFAIGGDSIKSIQIISRMSRAGYKLEMRDLYQYPVISELAPHVKKLELIPDQSAITGTIPLIPIQELFFQQAHMAPHHYNQAVMLYSKEGFDKKAIEKVFSKIQEHHDALRMSYKLNNENGKMVQSAHDLSFPLSFQEYNLKNHENCFEELNTQINKIQASIDLENGPLMKLGLFHLNDGDRLLIAIHHLVIDGISWRILFEDIETLYNQYKRGEKLVLPSKTDSFKTWAEELSAYANSKTFLKEKTYWQNLESLEAPSIPKDFETDDNYIKDNGSLSFTLSEEETEHLLTRVNKAFGTETYDILLATVGLGIKKTFGQDRVLMALEGHGREEILEDIDISRTVGWFTCLYPVLFNVAYTNDPGRQIKEIKETLRRIPNKGIGYGLLKYLTREENKKESEFKLNPRVRFNYLGQFDADIKGLSLFEIAKESPGSTISLNNQREYLLDVNGIIANNRLTMTLSYNKTHFKPETMTALIHNFQSEIRSLIAFCCSQEKIERTPSDFTYKELSIESINRLLEMYPTAEDLYTLTPMQEGMLFHALADSSSQSYFEQISYRIQGELNIPFVEKSLNELFKRHDVLRTAFLFEDIERPIQLVLKDRAIDFYYQDISNLEPWAEKKNFIEDFKKSDKDRSFDLRKGTLMRVSILRMGESEFEFTWSYHHILMDGWCVGILITEFFEIYNSFLENRPYRLPVVTPYRTYIQWLEKQDKEESTRYWQNYLDSYEEQVGVPKTKISTNSEDRYRNEEISIIWDKEKTAALNRLAAANHVTLNTVTQAIWGILLGKYNGKDDILFGSVVSGRPFELEGVESMMGLFINTIPVRIRFEGHLKFYALLQKIQEDALASEPYHYHPLVDIQSMSALKQNLIDHVFIFENFPIAERIEGYGSEGNKKNELRLKLTDIDVFEQTNYDFNVMFLGIEQLKILLRYNGNVYDNDYIKQIGDHLNIIIEQVIADPSQPISDIEIISEAARKEALNYFNENLHEKFEILPIQSRLAIVFRKYKTNTAIQCGAAHFTYAELEHRAACISQWITGQNIPVGSFIGIYIENRIDIIAAIIGILQRRCVFVPLDTLLPGRRIEHMISLTNIQVIVTDTTHETIVTGMKQNGSDIAHICTINDLFYLSHESNKKNNPGITYDPEDKIYVYFTSGTTGLPNAIVGKNKSLVQFLQWEIETIAVDETYRISQFTAVGFDAFLRDVFVPLLAGGAICITRNREILLDGSALIQWLDKNPINLVHCVPSLFRIINSEKLTPASFPHLKYVLLSGEPINPNELKRWYSLFDRRIQLVNFYGPTETTMIKTYHSIGAVDIEAGRIPAGRPLRGARVLILDKHMKICRRGTMGEIHIRTAYSTHGYLNNPELNARSFIKNPFNAGEGDLIYKTGDLGRELENGEIEILGRIDRQVKIRGVRIELENIENCLLKHNQIEKVIVMTPGARNSENYLCAYIVYKKPGSPIIDKIPTGPELRDFLAKELPTSMIPSHFIKIEKIPLTANGKIDRKALEKMGEIQDTGTLYAPPTTEMEKKTAGIWAELLKLDKVSINDNFFELGGNSLTTLALTSKLREIGCEVTLGEVLGNLTVKKLAAVINAKNILPAYVSDCIEKLNKGNNKKNIFIIHPMHGMVNQYRELAVLLETEYTVYGLQAGGLKTGTKMSESPWQMIADYIEQILSVQTEGPYIIAGFCIGTLIGYEIAARLERMGFSVEKLILFDTNAFFSRSFAAQIRALEYSPQFIKRWLHFSNERRFKKAIRDGNHRRTLAPSSEEITNNLRVFRDHILILDIIKAPILVLLAKDSDILRTTEANFSRMTKSKATVIEVPGDHESIFEKPYVENLSEAITNM
ncbi:MAG: hypothetical protein QG657_5247 [Acidobacteriota bacterium]|nr:hypothetical protein [Acidobacteriota bacterium]